MFPGAKAQSDFVDVLSYDVEISLNDSSNLIKVKESVRLRFKEDCDNFNLDLESSYSENKGMTVNSEVGVKEEGNKVSFNHQNHRLNIQPINAKKGDERTYYFEYSGIPKDGLIIGKNKFEERTFFGDNWPNRAHHWIACVDHPSDKAKINFTVIAPKHYDCVATGTLQKTETLGKGYKKHTFQSKYDLPTKVMVIGLANFAVNPLETDLGFPTSVWSYQKDSAQGYSLMKIAPGICQYFIGRIGDYPYEKLANVQSTTRYGGMENAGNIFYDEMEVKGKHSMEALIAHEIAHQWFGNSASEADWEHVWLSEGFATYFTDLYWEKQHGVDRFQERMKHERDRVIKFARRSPAHLVDEHYTDINQLLNPNSYQKGAWVLHMLRREISDLAFWSGIRSYYQKYQYSNATSSEFFDVMEEVSRKELDWFENQWLYRKGHPVLSFDIQEENQEFYFEVTQEQPGEPFIFPLEISLKDGEIQKLRVEEKKQRFKLPSNVKLGDIEIDPNVNLLWEKF